MAITTHLTIPHFVIRIGIDFQISGIDIDVSDSRDWDWNHYEEFRAKSQKIRRISKKSQKFL